jgi:hypothetical protein
MIYDNEDATESNTSKEVNTLADLRELIVKFPLEDSDCNFKYLMDRFDNVKYIQMKSIVSSCGFLIFYKSDLSDYTITTCSLESAKIFKSLWKNGCFDLGEE